MPYQRGQRIRRGGLWPAIGLRTHELSVVIVFVGLVLLSFFIVRVLAVDDMTGHEVVHDFADDLNPKHAT